jgi:hypothetical protein
MYRLTKSPDAIVQIFTSLCLSQVKEQLPENLIYIGINPASFICNGHLYSFIHNLSLILDESLDEFALNLASLNFHDRVN